MGKILIKYSKTDRMKFISHLELIRVIERALRRAEVPLSFSQGYNPHPKIAFAAPLSVGVSSEGDYLNIEVDEKIDLEEFKKNINNNLPDGITFISCKYIDEKAKSLMSVVNFGTYISKCKLEEEYNITEIKGRIKDFLEREEINYKKISRKNKKEKIINIREMIKDLFLLEMDGKDIFLKMTIATGSQGNLKPEVVVEKLKELECVKIDDNKTRFHRIELFHLSKDKSLIPIENIG